MSISVYDPPSHKIVHLAYADFVSRQLGRPVHIVQYDDSLPILAVKMFSDGNPYILPSDADVSIRLRKPDGKNVYNPALGHDSERRTVYFEVTQQFAAYAGEFSPVVEVYVPSGQIASSSPINIIIDRNPIPGSDLVSSNEYKTVMKYAEEAVDAAADASASRSAAKISETNAKASETKAKTSEVNAKASETKAKTSEVNAKTSETKAKTSETNAKISETNAKNSENQAKQYADSWKGSLLPQGSVAFAQLPTSGNVKGHMYNVNEAFETDARFKEGVGFSYPAGTNVYWTADGKWDCLSGVLTMEVTQAEYDALSNAEKMSGTIYYISDADNVLHDANGDSAGLMSAADKNKLDGIAEGATRVLVDTALSSSSANPIQNKAVKAALDLKASLASPALTGAPTAPTAAAGTNSTQIATTGFVRAAINALINGAPDTLDTLKEIADALAENDTVVAALDAAIGGKVDKVSGKGLSTNDYTTAEKTKLATAASMAENAYEAAGVAGRAATGAAVTASDAYAKANIAANTATNAYTKANSAEITATNAYAAASAAANTVSNAYATANMAASMAENAYEAAGVAGRAATGAAVTASDAYAKANIAANTATNAYTKANSAEITATNAYTKANAAVKSAAEINARLNSTRLSIGDGSNAEGGYSVAIGINANTYDICSIAFGSSAVAAGNTSTAIGISTNASAHHSIAIGPYAVAGGGTSSFALGPYAKAAMSNAIAIGHVSNASQYDAIAIGANVDAYGRYATAIGSNAGVNAEFSVAVGADAHANGNGSVSLGNTTRAEEGYATAIGVSAKAYLFCTALGGSATANTRYSVALGYYAKANGNSSMALGHRANVAGESAVALGYMAQTSNDSSIQLGNASTLSSITAKVGITVTSDGRDKADVEGIPDGAVDFLKKVRAVSYVFNGRGMYIDDENLSEEDKEKKGKYGLCAYDREAHAAGLKKGRRRRVGVVAQEVQKALEDVFGNSSYANLVNDNLFDFDPSEIPEDVESQLAVNYEGFIPFIIKGMQELDGRIHALESRGEAIYGKDYVERG